MSLPDRYDEDDEYRINWARRPGNSFGLEYPVRFDHDVRIGWFVYVFETGQLLAENLREWEVQGVCIRENEKRVKHKIEPDISAIDSTP
jgi:hypothetical protein